MISSFDFKPRSAGAGSKLLKTTPGKLQSTRPSSASSSRGSKISHHNTSQTALGALGEIPLMDEVNEVIEKEKTLASLKLIEQQQLAQEWKQKYENLVGKVLHNINVGIVRLKSD
jgi:hypothetical protein